MVEAVNNRQSAEMAIRSVIRRHRVVTFLLVQAISVRSPRVHHPASPTATTTAGPRPIGIGKINMLLASLALLFVAGTYWLISLLPEAFALLLLVVPC